MRSARPKPFFDFRRADFFSTAVRRGWDIVSLFLIRTGQGEVKYAACKSKKYEDCFQKFLDDAQALQGRFIA